MNLTYGLGGPAAADKAKIAIIFPVIVAAVLVALSLLADVEVPNLTGSRIYDRRPPLAL